MASFKALLNSLSNDSALHQLSDYEVSKLRKVYLEAYQDLEKRCNNYNLAMMLLGEQLLVLLSIKNSFYRMKNEGIDRVLRQTR